jgi:hypothetical protein
LYSDFFSGIGDAIAAGEQDPSNIGSQFFLPHYHVGKKHVIDNNKKYSVKGHWQLAC